MSCIVINVPGNVALINHVRLGNLEFNDKAPSCPKIPQTILYDVRHYNGTLIVNINRYAISIKIIFARLTDVVGQTCHTGDTRRFSGDQKPRYHYRHEVSGISDLVYAELATDHQASIPLCFEKEVANYKQGNFHLNILFPSIFPNQWIFPKCSLSIH